MRILAPLLCLALLSGCTSDLTTLRELAPVADDFNGALASEYRDFAGSEAEQGRHWVAEHFAAKGLKAFHGVDVAPDVLDASIAEEQAAEITVARAQLTKILNPQVKAAAPQDLARTQLLFDCWQQQVTSGIAPEKALCKQEFSPTLNHVLETVGSEVYGQAFSRHIVFAPNVVTLKEGNMSDINDVLCEVAGEMHKDYWVELRAYVGKKTSQRKLTEARLGAVKKALVKGGVASSQIRIRREGGKRVILSHDNIPMNTKVVTVSLAAETNAKGAK